MDPVFLIVVVGGSLFCFLIAAIVHFFPDAIGPAVTDSYGLPRAATKKEAEILMGKTPEQRRRKLRTLKLICFLQGVFFASLPWTSDYLSSQWMKMGKAAFDSLERAQEKRRERAN